MVVMMMVVVTEGRLAGCCRIMRAWRVPFHHLQVDVVLALGESVTAAFGVEGKRGGLVRPYSQTVMA